MDILKKAFIKLGELEQLGLPAGRTLENRLHQGVVLLGNDVPPLRTMKIGGARVVSRADLVWWLRATGGIESPAGETRPAAALDAEEGAPVRRRGRPRRAATGDGQ
jgi:hypothetical protein